MTFFLVDTNISVMVSLMWEKAEVPVENPRVEAEDHGASYPFTYNHACTVHHGERTQSAVRSTDINHESTALLGHSSISFCGHGPFNFPTTLITLSVTMKKN